MKDEANIGIGGVIAIVIVTTILLGAFVVPYFLSLVDTTPAGSIGSLTMGDPTREEHYATAGAHIDIDETIYINDTAVWLTFPWPNGVLESQLCSIGISIREVGPTLTGRSYVEFHTVSVYGERNKPIEFNAEVVANNQLEPGRYWYVVDLQCVLVDTNAVNWAVGSPNRGTSGNVETGVWLYWYVDGVLREYHPDKYITLEISGSTTEPTGEPAEEEKELIDTTGNGKGEEPPSDATVIFIVGILFLLLALVMMALGSKGGSILLILGLILLIIAVLILGYASYVVFTFVGVGGLALKRRK